MADGMEFYWVIGQTNLGQTKARSMATVLVRTKENHRYLITTPNSTDFTCTCPDCVYRNKECKHITALKLALPRVGDFVRVSLADALEIIAGTPPEKVTRMMPDGSIVKGNGTTISATLTPDAVEAVKEIQEPEEPKVMPEDDYDVKDIESLRKVMLAMRHNNRTEDEAFDKLRLFLRTDGITEENKNQVKEWMTLIMQSWDDLLEEIDDVAD